MRHDPFDISRLVPEWQSETQLTLAPPDSLLWARIVARLRPRDLDRQLISGVTVREGTPLAIHAERITSVSEREALARALRRSVGDAYSDSPWGSSRIEINAREVVGAEDFIDSITLRLHSPRPVTAVGMARLRQVLNDGSSPLYRYGRGDLAARLTAVFAAL